MREKTVNALVDRKHRRMSLDIICLATGIPYSELLKARKKITARHGKEEEEINALRRHPGAA